MPTFDRLALFKREDRKLTRAEWRAVLRKAAAETLRAARRAALVYDASHLQGAVGCHLRLAG